MDARLPDDLSDLERRLAGWRPSEDGLEPDRMLFAAGRASARQGLGRILWPALAGCLAVLATALGLGLAHERAERLALARRLQDPAAPPPAPAPIEDPLPSEVLPPTAYLAARRALERDPDAPPAPPDYSPAPSPPVSPVLRVWGRGLWPEP